LFIVVAIMAMEVMPMVMLPSSKTNAASEPGPAPAAVAAKAPEPPRAKIEARVKFTGMQFGDDRGRLDRHRRVEYVCRPRGGEGDGAARDRHGEDDVGDA